MQTEEEQRHESEAKAWAPLPDWKVTEYLQKVEKARGLVEAQRLANTIRELRKQARKANMATRG